MKQPRVLVLRAPGINRDEDAAAAIELAGGLPERVHVNRVVAGDVRMGDYAMVIVPGGFSYGDHLGAGKLLAVDLAHRLGEQLVAFVADGRPVIGICNGFQVLVKAGILPGTAEPQNRTTSEIPRTRNQEPSIDDQQRLTMIQATDYQPQATSYQPLTTSRQPQATLTDNQSGQFECRWVRLAADPTSPSIFTRGIERSIEVPIAHGEGRFVVDDAATLADLEARGQIALRYIGADGAPAGYPANPNGSDADIAGICNVAGTVLGLMPHPENAIVPHQHPRWTREAPRAEGDGLALFRNAVRYAGQV
jgi:phosphoribosylformylglycinamidine synthase I